MDNDRSLFAEDTAAHRVAASLGFALVRRFRSIEVTDEKALTAAGFVKPKPDYGRIAAALDAGREVPGAQWGGREYVLKPQGEQ